MLKTDLPYRYGLISGLARFYYDNGVLMAKVEYSDGTETGKMFFYDNKGHGVSPFALPNAPVN